MDVSDLGSAGSESFSRGALLAFHKSSIGSEVRVRSVRSRESRRAWSWRGLFRRRGWSEAERSFEGHGSSPSV
jgi:hypothetical protein